MLRAALLRGEHAQRLVGGARRVVERLRIFQRNSLVVLAVHHQEWTAHLLHHAVEPERLELLQRGVQRINAEIGTTWWPGTYIEALKPASMRFFQVP